MTNAEAEKLLDETCARLMEHFDAVQILVTREVEKGTALTKRGQGNYFARVGMCRDFLQTDQAYDMGSEIARRIDPPDSGDTWKAP